MSYGANKYKKTSIMTANRGQILIMLYEGAIRQTQKAQDCITANDMAGKGEAIVKVHDIINELLNSLNFEVGGPVARELESLYNYMITQLIEANMENKVEPLQNVQKLLGTLLEGWKGAVDQVNRESAQVKQG